MMDGDLKLYPLWPAASANMLLSVTYPASPLPHYISVGQLSSFISSGGITLPLAIAQGGTGAVSAAEALTALNAAPLTSPIFNGTPSAPTQLPGDDSTRLATTAYVKAATGAPAWDNITNKPATFPPTLPIAESGVTNLVSDLATKAPLASPAFTGTPTSTTASAADSTTRIATTAYVQAQTVALSGDVTASALLTATRTATVTGLQGRPVAATGPTSNQVLQWNGSTWLPATLSTTTSAGGTAGQLQYNSAGALAGVTMVGDATLNTATGALTLASPNANVGTFQGITVNAKGLVTAATTQNYISANQTITLSGDVAGTGTTAIATTIGAAAVTYAKIQNVAASRLLGNPTGGAAAPSEITLGTNLSFSGTTLNAADSGGITAGTVTTKTTNYTVQASDLGNTLVLGGVTLTLTLPAGIFTPGKTLGVSVTASNSWSVTNSTGLTMAGLNSTGLQGGSSGTFVANADGTTLNFIPGTQVLSTAQIGGVKGLTATANNFLTGTTNLGAFTAAQPAFTNLSGTATIAQGGTGQTSAGAALTALGGISGNQTITLSGAISGSGTTAITTTLATVGIGSGGTGSTSAATARTALGAAPTASPTFTGDVIVGGGIRLATNTNPAFTADTGWTNVFAPDGTVNARCIALGTVAIGDSIVYRTGTHHIQNATASVTYAQFHSGGSYNLSGSWIVLSDQRLKRDVVEYERGLSEICELRPVRFTYRKSPFHADGAESFGLIAQDVEPWFPELVSEYIHEPPMLPGDAPVKPEKFMALDYNRLVFALVNAVRELSSKVEALEEMLADDGR